MKPHAIVDGCSLYLAPVIKQAGETVRDAERRAVRRLVEEVFGAGAALKHHPDGRPYVDGFSGQISVSHTSGAALLAVSGAETLIGVDIERDREQLKRVAPKFVNYSDDGSLSLLQLWTAKEAAFKAAGEPDLTVGAITVEASDTGATAILPDRRRLEISYITEGDMIIAVATHPDRKAQVIARIRRLIAMRGESQAAFARSIGLDPANMSKHLSGRLPLTDGLINRIVADLGVSKQWLVTGAGAPYGKPLHADFMQGGRVEATASAGTPVYDIDVVAGCDELSMMFTDDRIVGHISLPRLRADRAIVRVSGDSMAPVIAPGAWIAIDTQRISAADIHWGQIYVIVMDDQRLVKYLRRNPDPMEADLVSANSDYETVTVDLRDIRALYQVEAVINYDLIC